MRQTIWGEMDGDRRYRSRNNGSQSSANCCSFESHKEQQDRVPGTLDIQSHARANRCPHLEGIGCVWMKWVKPTVVKSVEVQTCGSTRTTTGALNCSIAKLVEENGLNDPHSQSSSRRSRNRRATVAQRVFSTLAQGRNFLWERSELRKSSRRQRERSETPLALARNLFLVIIQLLLKNNIKFYGVFERNVRAGVYS